MQKAIFQGKYTPRDLGFRESLRLAYSLRCSHNSQLSKELGDTQLIKNLFVYPHFFDSFRIYLIFSSFLINYGILS